MGEETARLRAEIDQTRENLTRDVDLLAEKTSPSKIAQRRVEKTKGALTGLKDKVMGTLPGSDDDDERYGYGYYAPQGSSTSSSGGVGSAVSGAVGTVREQAEGNPLAAGLVAFGVGWLVSSLLPASEAEQRAARRAVETLKEDAQWAKRPRG